MIFSCEYGGKIFFGNDLRIFVNEANPKFRLYCWDRHPFYVESLLSVEDTVTGGVTFTIYSHGGIMFVDFGDGTQQNFVVEYPKTSITHTYSAGSFITRFVMDGVEVPYIPGSSVKGMFRSFMDTFIRSYKGYKSHNGFTCSGSGGNTCYSHIKRTVESLVKHADYLKLINVLWRNLCLSCKVYGSSSYRSKVVFYVFMPSSEIRLGIKPGYCY